MGARIVAGALLLGLIISGCSGGNASLQTGQGSAVVVVSDGPVYAFGNHLVDENTNKTFTVTNTSTFLASAMSSSFALSAHFSYLGGAYPGTGGSCGVSLEGGHSCTVVVSFQPQYPGSFEEALIIKFASGSRLLSSPAVHLTGTGLLGASGSLDVTWKGQGWVSPSGVNGSIVSILPVPDGSLWAIGNSAARILVMRLLPSGDLDPSLDSVGWETLNLGADSESAANASLQYDGKILIVGKSTTASVTRGLLVRVNTDGSVDSSFGSANGVVLSKTPSALTSVVMEPNQDIVAVGYSNNGTDNDMCVVRFTWNGALDTTFGTGGIFAWGSMGVDERAEAVSFNANQIYVAGEAGSNLVAFRLTGGGALDTSYGSNGIVNSSIAGGGDSVGGMTGLSDGSIFIGGATGNAGYVVSLTPSGNFASFGTAGVASVNASNSNFKKLLVQNDGKLALLGNMAGSVAMVRFNSDGSLDGSFGTNGFTVTNLPGTASIQSGLLLESGKIVAAGQLLTGSGTLPLLLRYWP